jgi:peptide/nickel transport system substrate-binding protein
MQAPLTAIAAALSLLLATPVRAETVVRWVTPEPALTWDPHGADHAYTAFGHRQVYEQLVGVASNLALRSRLATSWQLVAPDRWRFELRSGVRFHDGTPLTAEDVVFSLERARTATSDFKGILNSVAQVRADGPAAIEILTRGPDPLPAGTPPLDRDRVGALGA